MSKDLCPENVHSWANSKQIKRISTPELMKKEVRITWRGVSGAKGLEKGSKKVWT